MQEVQRLSFPFLSKEVEENLKKEITTIVAQTFSELTSKAGTSKDWLSKNEACSYLSVSNGTIDKFINEYSLKVVVIEGVRRFKKTDLDEFYIKHQN